MRLTIEKYRVTTDDGKEFGLVNTSLDPPLWKIVDNGYCLTNKLEWVRDPSPSNQTEDFILNTRFTYVTAMELLLLLNSQKS